MYTENGLLLQDNILTVLSANGIVIMPCDTIYGIVGISPSSEDKIRGIKGRQETKPFLILIKRNWIFRYTEIKIEKYFLNLWPAALTLIVPGRKGGTVALRVPDDKRLQNLLSGLNKPLISTSVNRSGKPALFKSKDIKEEFGKDVDLFINEGDLTVGSPSTIVDISQKPYKLVRKGSCVIDTDMLL